MYSFSRGAYAGALAGLFFIGMFKSRKVLIGLFVFLLFWKSIVPVSVVDRVENVFLDSDTTAKVLEGKEESVEIAGQKVFTSGRRVHWRNAFDYFLEHPILGTGYRTYAISTGSDTHNVYLKTLAEQGMIGFMIYLWLYLLAFRSGWRLYKRADEELVKAFGFGFVCAVVGSMVVNFFGDRWTYLQLGGLYWIFWALVDQENSRIMFAEEKAIEKAEDLEPAAAEVRA
jgi:O-antigen ligase